MFSVYLYEINNTNYQNKSIKQIICSDTDKDPPGTKEGFLHGTRDCHASRGPDGKVRTQPPCSPCTGTSAAHYCRRLIFIPTVPVPMILPTIRESSIDRAGERGIDPLPFHTLPLVLSLSVPTRICPDAKRARGVRQLEVENDLPWTRSSLPARSYARLSHHNPNGGGPLRARS